MLFITILQGDNNKEEEETNIPQAPKRKASHFTFHSPSQVRLEPCKLITDAVPMEMSRPRNKLLQGFFL